MTNTTTLAIVLAGGAGVRMGADRPKQLLELGGRTLLERSIAAFEGCDGIDAVLVMMAPEWLSEAEDIVARAGFTKVVGVEPGGLTRRETTFAALKMAPAGTQNVLVHDAARPLVSAALIRRCLDALVDHEAVSPVVVPTDTLYRVAAEGEVLGEVCQRVEFRMAQTPQAFRLDLLLKAHELAHRDNHESSTDDSGIVARFCPDVPVQLVEGDEWNIKVTVAGDLAVAGMLASRAHR